jgi:hypothetical protein
MYLCTYVPMYVKVRMVIIVDPQNRRSDNFLGRIRAQLVEEATVEDNGRDRH